MPYVFALLTAANVALFGYFWHQSSSDAVDKNLQLAQAQLQKPLNYQNNTAHLPPLIGEK